MIAIRVYNSSGQKNSSGRDEHFARELKKTEIYPDLTPDRASGERRPIVARSG